MDSLYQDSDSIKKQCTVCKGIFPATGEYFHRDKNTKDGLCYPCKECNKAKTRAHYAKNPEKAKEYSKKYVAEHREETAQYQKQYAEEHRAELAEYKKNYYAAHQEENKIRSKKWYVEHRQYISDYGKQYRRSNAAKKSERDKRYRRNHIRRISENNRRYKETNRAELASKQRLYYNAHREEALAYAKLYGQTERGIIAKRAGAHNRRARKKRATGKHTTAQLYELYQQQEGKCFYCKKELDHSRNSWHGDHYIPLSRGGSNDISNIVIACPTCNRRKHDKLPHEWDTHKRIDG